MNIILGEELLDKYILQFGPENFAICANTFWNSGKYILLLLIRTILKEGIVDEDHPGEDEEVDEPYDVERVLEVKDTQEVSVTTSRTNYDEISE